MKQVVVIHGADSFKTYQEYLHSLKKWPVTCRTFLPRSSWKSDLPRVLGKRYQVLSPAMPNKSNARYAEWKVWFERMRPYIHRDVIFVGHSLGGMFLAKYLAENRFPKKIEALILVAAPHNRTADIGDFRLPKSLRPVTHQAKNIILIYSQDDPIVPLAELRIFQRAWPTAQTIIFKKRGHFNQPRFPELVRLIKQSTARS